MERFNQVKKYVFMLRDEIKNLNESLKKLIAFVPKDKRPNILQQLNIQENEDLL
jgi:hypothetical protein